MLVLAAALCSDDRQAGWSGPGPYSQWFVRNAQDGQIRGTKFDKTVQSFLTSTHCLSLDISPQPTRSA